MASDIEIARAATLRPIRDVAAGIGLAEAAIEPHGHHIAKLSAATLADLAARPAGKLILVTAVNPTPAGEGKTTTTIGLADALNRIGRRAVIALREPSLGPVFGRKGGATGGGQAQVLPMEKINLHFTGDFHAITAAHNLLAAMIDNAIHFATAMPSGATINPRTVTWRRVMDMNDRALRQIVAGMGTGNHPLRETGFDITVASEVMAILCLASDLADLQARLARIRVAKDTAGNPVTAGDIGAAGAMAALLVDAMQPNLVQTIHGSAALIHGGPFANIAHGCNSVIATSAALALGEFAVTEAGFGADLGAEKFAHIKCRQAGLAPAAAVVVATVRALKYHGGMALADLGTSDAAALDRGLAVLARHVENLQSLGLPVAVAINAFASDTEAEQAQVLRHCRGTLGIPAHLCRHWADGPAGAEDLARSVAALADANADPHARFTPLYASGTDVLEALTIVATRIHRAGTVTLSAAAQKQLASLRAEGLTNLPVCLAKTPYSFTADERQRGAVSGHDLPIRELRLAAGAGFIVALAGDIATMPGLPKQPSALGIHLDEQGRIEGLS
ncbi:formate--tetrahydrofolate ligase [Sandarakinorhabdus cyanobacteriorum]|uniref:Formate--tetrahydrofolate ligase n=1 Tax=Sandarakinorhabdus cyanobacteriorum TaxID=1981098 RepID=A0A255YGA0_9SPHN|nr:formate--tetrahydrofolate ligase [Sandarakinorhabdus cyanobacteriorum]OYQ28287.1 formate--tetrahydrofolate ligase [Sandarakinorhabdus cyanobacteriorum]